MEPLGYIHIHLFICTAQQRGLEILSFRNLHRVVSKEHVAELLARTLLVRQANINQDARQAWFELPLKKGLGFL